MSSKGRKITEEGIIRSGFLEKIDLDLDLEEL